ncbi:MAG: hypothetical protein LBG52_06655 [Candidatus Peribacteria bacterium]|jgi:DNA-directed RNA polymerase sigma subunit (sigma70/sigma32)|nr:hypothetical protein [Candidatus Peribacteria bacterium]
MGFEEIATKLELSRQRVQQIYVRALKILKKSGAFNHLKNYS